MLTSIEFKNYKAFKEGHLDIKPITILLGANSVGKSSIIQMFLLLQETALAEHYKSALKLYGGFFSLGEGINLFRNKNEANTLGLSIEFNDESIAKFFKNELIERFEDEVINYSYFLVTQLINPEEEKNFLKKVTLDKKNHVREITNLRNNRRHGKREKIEKSNLITIVEKANEIANKVKDRDRSIIKEITNSLFFSSKSVETVLSSIINSKDDIFQAYDFLSEFNSLKADDSIKINYEFIYADGVLKIKNFKVKIGNIENIVIDFEKINEPTFISCSSFDLSRINPKSLSNLKDAFDNSKTVFSFIKKKEFLEQRPNSTFNTFFINTISYLIDKAEEAFHTQSINYVSPLRAYPKRYYFLDKAKTNIFLDTLDGEAIAEILKENSGLKNSVNSWFKKFNLHIDIGQLKDIIHQIVVKQNSLDLDLTDVGFGVSQVLPVIIQGFLSKDKSITLIEQPEIHLHPKMQADLADLFIDITNDGATKSINKFLIIETHSEYLLKRLRRRISEGLISNEHVGLYYIEPSDRDQSATIRRIEITPTGSFDWPLDFYSGDLSDDVTKFLSNQI